MSSVTSAVVGRVTPSRRVGRPRVAAAATAAAAFTLVELLVVIGIIALLISILLPALNKARESSNSVKCASNLRTIGQGLGVYCAENKGSFPAAYMYKGAGQISGTPSEGYVHWSSFLYGDRDKRGTLAAFKSLTGWDAFQCPSFRDGGLAPTNTYPDNLGAGLSVDAAGVLDEQAPRLAYTVNEAIMPRNKFSANFDDGNQRTYQFVKAAMVKGSARTVLATEFTQSPEMVAGSGRMGGGTVSKSHRPVHGFYGEGGTYDIAKTSPSSNIPILRNYEVLAGLSQPFNENRLAWVGRNHGKAKLNAVNQDQRQTNFLYVDGHVETKRLCETLYPEFQWGDQFYSIRERSRIATNVPTEGQVKNLK